MNEKPKLRGIAAVGVMFAVCFLVGSDSVDDRFHLARYVAITLCLSAVFVYNIFTAKKRVIPNIRLFYIAQTFIVLSGISMFWATDFGEAIFAFSKYLVTFLVALVFYGLLQEDSFATRKMIGVSSCAVLVAYLIAAYVQIIGKGIGHLYGISGISGHKNMLSLMLFVLSAYSLAPLAEQKNKTVRILTVVLCAVALITIVLLRSRAVMLGVIVAAVLFGLMLFARKRNFGFPAKTRPMLILVSVAALLLFFTVGLRMFSEKSVPLTSQKSEFENNLLSSSSLSERCLLWEKTYQIIDDKPIFGCGIGNWQIEFPNMGLAGLYRADIWNVNFTRPHNEFLGIWSECGYVVFIIYLVFICSLVILSFSSICKAKDMSGFVFGAVTLSVFAGYCINSLFDFPSSRTEGAVWLGVMSAILYHYISSENGNTKQIGKSWNFLFLTLSVFFVAIGLVRLKGERNLVEIQKAKDRGNWRKVEQLASESISVFYTIDPTGMPMHWHLGKAQNCLGDKNAVVNLRKAFKHSPYCKENLNDLGLTEYFVNQDVEKAEFYLKEGIRISPNYLYSSFNLASIYMNEKRYSEAKEVIDQIYMDENKRDVLIGDIEFFDPNNVELRRKDIEEQYEVAVQMRSEIDSLMKK